MNDKFITPCSSENVSLGNSTSVKKRIHWLDVSRGLAFLMVIYSHLEYSNDAVMRYFTPVFLTSFSLCQDTYSRKNVVSVKYLSKEHVLYCFLSWL